MALSARRTILVTGAAGGMGRACARLLGCTADLVLTDAAASALARLADELREDGYTVASEAGDLGDDALLARIAGHMGPPSAFGIVHAAGLSPSMADWRRVMAVNLVATEKLLRAIEPLLAPGAAAVLIASAAGHAPFVHPEVAALAAEPLAPGFLDRMGAAIAGVADGSAVSASALAYIFSKQEVISIAERRAVAWGRRGARIVSISPGSIQTPMGRREHAETPGAAELAKAAAIGREGTAMEIALAARFLLGDEAAYITGCDLKVDGGSIAATRALAAARQNGVADNAI